MHEKAYGSYRDAYSGPIIASPSCCWKRQRPGTLELNYHYFPSTTVNATLI